MGGMEGHEGGSEIRGSVVQTLIALAVILVAFRVADVAPVRAEAPAIAPEAPYVSRIRAVDEALARGDAARRIGEVAKARTAYLAGFFRARQEGAVAGMLRAADAFAALGDHEVAERCRGEAAVVAARGVARDDEHTVASRMAR